MDAITGTFFSWGMRCWVVIRCGPNGCYSCKEDTHVCTRTLARDIAHLIEHKLLTRTTEEHPS